MARQILKEVPDTNVTRSLIQFDPKDGEELFLLFSAGRQNGPGIESDGRGSPWMSHPNPKWSHRHITDPDIQRWGTWFLDHSTKKADLEKLEKKIAGYHGDSSSETIEQLKDLQSQNVNQEIYVDEFQKSYPEYRIVAMQGIGDLTMNHWNVGYLRSPFTGGKPEILHLLDEPIHERVYSCIIKWRDRDRVPRYEIRDVRFNRYVFNTDQNDPMVVQIDGKGVADQIEFAVYGQQTIKPNGNGSSGEVFEIGEIVHQFSDVRHLFQLPNLNPPAGRPRYYFGRNQTDDIWFGEAELLDNRNLRRAALAGSIELNRLYQGLGASIEQITNALTGSASCYTQRTDLGPKRLRYDEIPTHLDAKWDSSIAEWRIVAEDNSLIEIRLRENRYPCTMIGVNDKGQFYFYAWKGTYSQWPGLTLRQAARQLLLNGASSAVLCDEGADVFQYLDNGQGMTPVINSGRGQVRALFVVAHRQDGPNS